MPDVRIDVPPSATGIHKRDTGMIDSRLKPLIPQGVFGSPEFSGLRECVKEARRKLREDFPDATGEEIGLYSELLLGPFNLRGENLSRTNETPMGVREKELSAILQHHLTHATLYASIAPSVDKTNASTYWSYCLNTYKAFKRQQDIISSMRQDTKLSAWWNGLKSEIGVIKTFVKAGYKIILPEYAYDRNHTKDDEREVLEWDLNEGIDFIAIKDGRAILVDAKGELIDRKTEQLRTSPSVVSETRMVQRLPHSLRNKLSIYTSQSSILHVRIIVPTNESDLSILPPIPPLRTREDLVNVRKAFIQFGSLKPGHERAILAQLSHAHVSVAA